MKHFEKLDRAGRYREIVRAAGACHIRKAASITFAIISGAALSGCKVGPDYHAPKLHVGDSFGATSTTQPATRPVDVDLTRWWETFNDPMLNALITEAVQSNLDVMLAQARVRQARAELESSNAGLFPTLDSSASFTRSRSSRNASVAVPVGTGGGSSGGTGGSGSSPSSFSRGESSLYQAGFDAGWELDVFGGTRRAIEAADSSLQASVEARRNAVVTLLAEVAQNYILLRGQQHELAIVRSNVASQADTLNLQQTKLRAGITNDLTVAQTEALLSSTQSQIPALETNVLQTIHRLSVLLNREPTALQTQLSRESPIPVGPAAIPAGLPSDLLMRRPDVRQAERQLAAATANIGVATADLFPKFSLTGSFGVSSAQFKHLGDSDSMFFSYGPAMRWRIFDANSIRANIRVQNALQEQSVIVFRQTVLGALEDVENALVAYNREQARRGSLQQSVTANRRAVDLARQLNDAGLVDFLNVLNAQQSLYQAEDQLAQSDQAVSTNLVALYKALGGGWETTDGAAADAEPTMSRLAEPVDYTRTP